jgi:hypothetical protein
MTTLLRPACESRPEQWAVLKTVATGAGVVVGASVEFGAQIGVRIDPHDPHVGRLNASTRAGVMECSPPMKPRNDCGCAARSSCAARVMDARSVMVGRAVRIPARDASTSSTSSKSSTWLDASTMASGAMPTPFPYVVVSS